MYLKGKIKESVVKHFYTLNIEQQKEIVKQYCKQDVEMFIQLFLREHIKSGEIADFHRDWIDWVCYEKLPYLAIVSPREHAKSTIISLAIPIHWACYNLKRFILIASDSSGQSELLLGSIRQELEDNEIIQLFYGNLVKPAVGFKRRETQKWSERELLTTNKVRFKAVSNRARIRGMKDKSIRPDAVIIDDIENEEDTNSEVNLQKSWSWFILTLMSIGSRNTQYIMISNYVSSDGIVGRLFKMKNSKWFKVFYTVFKAITMHNISDVTESNYTSFEPLWADWWDMDRIKDKIAQIEWLGFRREFLMDPSAKESTVFTLDSIDRSLKRGAGMTLVSSYAWDERTDFKFIVGGVDLNVKNKRKSDYFSFTTMAFREDGSSRVLNIRHGKYSPKIQRETIRDEYYNFGHHLVLVENNQYQDALVQDMNSETNIPIQGFTTTKQKFDPEIGINSLAFQLDTDKIDLPYASDPNTIELIDILVKQMKAFPVGHTGDILMSMWFAERAYFILSKLGMDIKSVEVDNNMYNFDALNHEKSF